MKGEAFLGCAVWFPDSGLLSKGLLFQQLRPDREEGLEAAAELGPTQRTRGQTLRQAGLTSKLTSSTLRGPVGGGGQATAGKLAEKPTLVSGGRATC